MRSGNVSATDARVNRREKVSDTFPVSTFSASMIQGIRNRAASSFRFAIHFPSGIGPFPVNRELPRPSADSALKT